MHFFLENNVKGGFLFIIFLPNAKKNMESFSGHFFLYAKQPQTSDFVKFQT